MAKSSVSQPTPDTLDHLIRLYNENKLSADELAVRATPCLIAKQQNDMLCLVAQLASEKAERYNIRGMRDTQLYRDAEAVYEARLVADVAADSQIRINAGRVVRRYKARLKREARQSVKREPAEVPPE